MIPAAVTTGNRRCDAGIDWNWMERDIWQLTGVLAGFPIVPHAAFAIEIFIADEMALLR